MSAYRNNDPTEWADKRRAAMERAKQIREERKNASAEGATFQPQINKRPSYLGSSDALDALTNKTQTKSAFTNDIFEQPLPGSRVFQPPPQQPSPSSDTLGREIKKFNAHGNGYNYPDPDQNQVNFKDRYRDEGRFNDFRDLDRDSGRPTKPISLAAHTGRNIEPTPQYIQQDETYVDDSDAFFSSLRGGDSYSNKDRRSNKKNSWNNDFATESALDAPPRQLAPKPLSSYSNIDKKITPRKQVKNERPEWNFDTNAVSAPTPSKEVMTSSPRGKGDLVQARSRLSLLKSKLRKSDEAPPTPDHSSYTQQYLRTQSVEQPFRDASNSSQRSGTERKGVKSQHAPRRDYRQDYDNYDYSQTRPSQQSIRSRSDGERGGENDWQYGREISQSGMNGREDLFDREVQSHRSAQPLSQYRESDRGSFDDRHNMEHRQQPKRQNQYFDSVKNGDVSKNRGEDVFGGAMGRNVRELSPSMEATPDVPSEFADGPNEQIECPDCGRKFNPGPYERHVKICKKVFLDKRKVFDTKQQRLDIDPDMKKIMKEACAREKRANKKAGSLASAEATPVGSKKEKWKADSEAFRAAMRAGKQLKKAIDTGGPLPEYVPSGVDPSFVNCPHCGRNFNQKAAERHIPQCQNIKARPSTLKKGGGRSAAKSNSLKASFGF